MRIGKSSRRGAECPCARRLALLGSTAIVFGGLLASPVFAIDECGPAPTAICDSGDADYPTFPDGILYIPIADLTLVVDSGAAIATGSVLGGILIDSAGGNIDLTLEGGSSIATTGSGSGISVGGADTVSVESAA